MRQSGLILVVDGCCIFLSTGCQNEIHGSFWSLEFYPFSMSCLGRPAQGRMSTTIEIIEGLHFGLKTSPLEAMLWSLLGYSNLTCKSNESSWVNRSLETVQILWHVKHRHHIASHGIVVDKFLSLGQLRKGRLRSDARMYGANKSPGTQKGDAGGGASVIEYIYYIVQWFQCWIWIIGVHWCSLMFIVNAHNTNMCKFSCVELDMYGVRYVVIHI